MSVTMPQRRWEPPAVLPKYKVAIAMRHADAREIPRGATAVLDLAEAHGWVIGDTTYARGDKLVLGEYRCLESVAIRLRLRDDRDVRIWAIWERYADTNDARWSYGGGQVLEVGVGLISPALVRDIRAVITTKNVPA